MRQYCVDSRKLYSAHAPKTTTQRRSINTLGCKPPPLCGTCDMFRLNSRDIGQGSKYSLHDPFLLTEYILPSYLHFTGTCDMFRFNSSGIGQGSKYFLHLWCGEKYFCLRSYDLQGTGRTCHMSHEETERNIFAFDPMTSKAWVERVTCHIRIRCCIIHRALPSRTPHQSSDRTLQRGLHNAHRRDQSTHAPRGAGSGRTRENIWTTFL